jgi:hypothetical protein
VRVFLPLIFVVWLLAGALGRLPAQEPEVARPEVAGHPVATVVAGSGEPDAAAVDAVATAITAELPRLLPLFEARPQQPFFVHVHASRQAMPTALAEHLHPDSPAFALLGRHQIHLVVGEITRMGSALPGVVRHELVHELLDQYVFPNGRHLPRWFHEGLAQHLAGDTYLRASEDDLVWGAGLRRLLLFGELRAHFPADSGSLRLAYAQSYSYVSWLVWRFGLAELLAAARAADDTTSFEAALVGRTGRTTLQLEEAWRHHVVHGSGATWRVLLEQCFSYCLLALLPILVIALIRRLRAEERAARELARRAAAEVAPSAEVAPPADDATPRE